MLRDFNYNNNVKDNEIKNLLEINNIKDLQIKNLLV